MICKVKSTIDKYSMLKHGDTVAVGVSGGADSMCLLHILSKIRDEYDIILRIVHINHGIRGEEAERDEEFVRSYCEKNGLEFVPFHVDVPKLSKTLKLSEEECGRNIRYQCFSSLGTDKIATAHTMSDSAETVLFNLTRGTGVKGLSGISKVRGNIIRPLIECTRQEIEAYCRENGLSFVTDSTNNEDDYTRNKIRHSVIPVLKEINPSFEKSVSVLSENAEVQQDFISACACEALKKAENGKNTYNRKLLFALHEAVLTQAVHDLLAQSMSKDAESRHIKACCSIVRQGSGALEISKGVYFACDSESVYIKTAVEASLPTAFETKLVLGKTITPYRTYSVSLSDTFTGNVFDEIDVSEVDTEQLVLRTRKSGDTFTDIRRKNTKTLKKLYSEKKLDPDSRITNAVLALGDEVLWVEGIGTNKKFVSSNKSKRILIIKTEVKI